MDGFAAALVAHLHFRRHKIDAEYVPVDYGRDLPVHFRNRPVFMLDYAPEPIVLQHMIEDAESVVMLDHHVSAKEKLSEILKEDLLRDNTYLLLDLEHSGAVLAWKYFFPDYKVPNWLMYVQDRDLWKWELSASREVNAGIASHPFDFLVWEGEVHNATIGDLATAGAAILRYQKKEIDRHVAEARMGMLAGHTVPIVNATTLQSEILEVLAQGHPFAAGYRIRNDDKIAWSLRSDSNGVNVAEIAKSYFGGGHAHAAGFETYNSNIGGLLAR
jgi:oligoribonuclease NrnB/cAMP/cGMP phosphodiesterase (DHH superfamily)